MRIIVLILPWCRFVAAVNIQEQRAADYTVVSDPTTAANIASAYARKYDQGSYEIVYPSLDTGNHAIARVG